MRSSILPALVWAYWANIIYLIGMLGYCTLDTMNYVLLTFDRTVSNAVYLFLASLFVVDAVLYSIDWFVYAVKLRAHPDEPIKYRCEFVACIFQNLGSCLYLIAAILAFDSGRWAERILAINFLGVVAFLIESLLTFAGWFVLLRSAPSIHPANTCSIQVNTIDVRADRSSFRLEHLHLGSYVEHCGQCHLPGCLYHCLGVAAHGRSASFEYRSPAADHRRRGLLSRCVSLPSMLAAG